MTSVNCFIAGAARKSALAELMPVVYAELRRPGRRLLTYVAALTTQEPAAARHVSHATIAREWKIAQA